MIDLLHNNDFWTGASLAVVVVSPLAIWREHTLIKQIQHWRRKAYRYKAVVDSVVMIGGRNKPPAETLSEIWNLAQIALRTDTD